mgnify:CR=1 FL=1
MKTKKAKEWLKKSKQMKRAARTCRPENITCFKKAAQYAADKALEALLVCLVVIAVSGCGTISATGRLIQAVGGDVSAGAEAIQDGMTKDN